LDVRVIKESDGLVYMHHGEVEVKHLFIEAMKEVILTCYILHNLVEYLTPPLLVLITSQVLEWAGKNTDDLVVVILNPSDGDTETASNAIVTSLGLYKETDCDSVMNSLTVQGAKDKGSLPGGGHVYVVPESCVNDNYDPTIMCYEGVKFCYGTDKEDLFNQLWGNIDGLTKAAPPSPRLWMSQAHWQYSAASVVSGAVLFSSIILDEERSDLNSKVLDIVSSDRWPVLNFLELDNVCHRGKEIHEALVQRRGRKRSVSTTYSSRLSMS
jgi:hypothetical protein